MGFGYDAEANEVVDGTKSPLSEYNDAFQLLQRRRKMDPIHLFNDLPNSTESAQTTSGSESLPLNPIKSDQILSKFMTKTTYSGHDFDITMLEEPDGEPDGFTQILDDLEHSVAEVWF